MADTQAISNVEIVDMPDTKHFLTGFLQLHFDGKGGIDQFITKLDKADINGVSRLTKNSKGFKWFHLNPDTQPADAIIKKLGLNEEICNALLAEDTRPRFTAHGDGAVLILRGVNLNEGEDPTDMVSVRFWIERDLVVGIWHRRIFAVADVLESIERGNAPVTSADLIARIAYRLADRAEPFVAQLAEKMDQLEEIGETNSYSKARKGLVRVRQSSSVLRRYMVPQRDALTTMAIEDLTWLDDRQRSRINESAERITRLGEELDAIKDRAMIANDEILAERADRMNRTMLVLAAVTTIFLPVGFLTGLMGINVGGMPGIDSPYAFWIVCATAIVMGMGLWAYIKKSGMME